MNIKRYAGLILSVIVILALGTFALAELPSGTKAPNIKAPTLSGGTFNLSDNFKGSGKVVLLDIWATWCPPCRSTAPYLNELTAQYAKQPVKIVGISLDETKSDVVDFAKEHKLKYTIGLDPNAKKISAAKYLGANDGIPKMYIIDRKGKIRHIHTGFPVNNKPAQDDEIKKIKGEINALLKEK